MKFIENKYTNWYYQIIYKAQLGVRNNIYTERHHIIPKSLGGSDDKENMVVLTAREHFICHILLTKMTTGIDKIKMVHAAIGMKRSRSYQDRYINSRLYENIKREFAIISSILNTGKKMSEESKQKMSISSKGKSKSKEHASNISKALQGYKRGKMSNSEKQRRSDALKGRESPNKGNKYNLTVEQREKISVANSKRKLSDETKAKISASLKAKKLG